MTVKSVKSRKSGPEDRKPFSMDGERKRAMTLGQFKLLGESDQDVLDENADLIDSVKEWKNANRDDRKKFKILYDKLPESSDSEGPSLRTTNGYKTVALPKPSASYAVVWVTSKGQVVVEKDVVLLSMSDVIGANEEHPDMIGPRGSKFALMGGNAEVGDGDCKEEAEAGELDQDLFWSVGFLYKHFRTCGLMRWDRQMAQMRKVIKSAASREAAETQQQQQQQQARRKGQQGATGKYEGKLVGWKGTYGFVECTSGNLKGKTVFLHHSDICSAYLHLTKGLQMRFDVVADEADGDRRRPEADGQRRRQEGDEADGDRRRPEADGQRLRAVKVHPCLCEYSCAVHDNETSSKPKQQQKQRQQQQQQPRRRRRSSKSSSGKLNSSGEAAPREGRSASEGEGEREGGGSSRDNDDAAPPRGGGKRSGGGGGKRRQFNRKQRQSDAEAENES